VRDTLADALSLWADLPEETVERIKGVVGDLHAASLMHVILTTEIGSKETMTNVPGRLDDIEDGSDLRRGNPAAHGVFGIPQTVNAASHAIVEAVRKAHELSSTISGSAEIAFGRFKSMRHRGLKDS
jgi:hypothetical protein